MKRKFLYVHAAPSGAVLSASLLYLGTSVLEVKQARYLYQRAEQLGDYFSLFNHDAREFLDSIIQRAGVQPRTVDYVSLLKYYTL